MSITANQPDEVRSDMVERRALIFRFGHFPAKGYSVTRDQFVAANGETGTIPIGFDPKGLKHYEGEFNALDGETGEATFAVHGDEVFATTRMPSLIDRLREKFALKVSSVLGRADHVLRKIDLVDTPHIKDAVFFADQAEVEVFEGDEPEAVEFCDDGKLDMAQQQHEIAASLMPGLCSGRSKVNFASEPAGDRAARLMHDHAVHEGGAYCPGMDHHHGEVGMSDENEEVLDEGQEQDEEVTFNEEEMTPREKALFKRMKRLEGTVEKQGGELVAEKAVAFADSMTRGKDAKAYPAERASIVEGYQRAAAIDAKLGDTVTFTEGAESKTGSHLDAFKAGFAVRPRLTVRDPKVVTFELDPEPKLAEDEDAKAAREAERLENQEWAKARNRNPVGSN